MHISGELPRYATLTLAEVVTHSDRNDKINSSRGRQSYIECPLENDISEPKLYSELGNPQRYVRIPRTYLWNT